MHITPCTITLVGIASFPGTRAWEWDSGEPGSGTRESLGVGLGKAWEWDSGRKVGFCTECQYLAQAGSQEHSRPILNL